MMNILRGIAVCWLAVATLPFIVLGFLAELVASAVAAGWFGARQLLDWMAD